VKGGGDDIEKIRKENATSFQQIHWRFFGSLPEEIHISM